MRAEIEGLEALGDQLRTLAGEEERQSVGPIRNAVGRKPGWARVVAAAVLVVLAIGLTPPGRSVAEAVGDIVGIGDEPSDPSPPPHYRAKDGQVVLATGTTPGGEPFEIVGYATDERIDGQEIGSCVIVDFPGLGRKAALGATCASGEWQPDKGVHISNISFPGQRAEDLPPYVGGEIADAVTRIEIEVIRPDGSGETIDATIARLEGELLERIGGTSSMDVFLAFLPTTLSAEGFHMADFKVIASAYADDGSVIGVDRSASHQIQRLAAHRRRALERLEIARRKNGSPPVGSVLINPDGSATGAGSVTWVQLFKCEGATEPLEAAGLSRERFTHLMVESCGEAPGAVEMLEELAQSARRHPSGPAATRLELLEHPAGQLEGQ